MGEVVVKLRSGVTVKYKNAAIDITKRIVAAYFEDKTIVIPFENIAMIEKAEDKGDEIPSESYY